MHLQKKSKSSPSFQTELRVHVVSIKIIQTRVSKEKQNAWILDRSKHYIVTFWVEYEVVI